MILVLLIIFLDVKDPTRAKYQHVIKNKEIGLLEHEDPTALIKYSNNMQDAYRYIEEYNPDRKCKVLIVFGDVIASEDLIK